MLRGRLNRRLAPYLLSLPSWAYFLLLFLVPLGSMMVMATATGDPLDGYARGRSPIISANS